MLTVDYILGVNGFVPRPSAPGTATSVNNLLSSVLLGLVNLNAGHIKQDIRFQSINWTLLEYRKTPMLQ